MLVLIGEFFSEPIAYQIALKKSGSIHSEEKAIRYC
jgi:hypothetical protein